MDLAPEILSALAIQLNGEKEDISPAAALILKNFNRRCKAIAESTADAFLKEKILKLPRIIGELAIIMAQASLVPGLRLDASVASLAVQFGEIELDRLESLLGAHHTPIEFEEKRWLYRRMVSLCKGETLYVERCCTSKFFRRIDLKKHYCRDPLRVGDQSKLLRVPEILNFWRDTAIAENCSFDPIRKTLTPL